MALRNNPDNERDTVRVESADAGVTAGRDAHVTAGRDAVGRDQITQSVGRIDSVIQFIGGDALHASALAEEVRQDANQLARLLARIERDYESRAEQAIHGPAVRLELRLDEMPGAVAQALDQYLPFDRTVRALPSGTSIRDVFHSSGDREAGRLLILGEPGAGKTTLLLELARSLVREAREDSRALPIYVPLSRWARDRGSPRALLPRRREDHDPMLAYVARQLSDLYSVGYRTAERWLKEGRLLLLLDGLDEIHDHADREACVRALNNFMRHNDVSTVVCCRRGDYEALATRLECNAGVYIRPLDGREVVHAVEAAGPSLAGLAQTLTTDSDLRELCRRPVFLSIATLTYAGESGHRVPTAPDGEQRRNQLLQDYVARRLGGGSPRPTATHGQQHHREEKARQWLEHLARNLTSDEHTVATLGSMQPSWLPPVLRCSAVVPAALITFLIGRVLGSHVFSAIFVGAFVVTPLAYKYRFVERVRWSLRAAFHPASLVQGAIVGTIVGAVFGLLRNSVVPEVTVWPIDVTLASPIAGALVGMVVGAPALAAIGAISVAPVNVTATPYESFKRSWMIGLALASVAVVLVFAGWHAGTYALGLEDEVRPLGTPLFGLPDPVAASLNVSLGVAVLFGLSMGVGGSLGHLWTRLGLWLSGQAPIRYVTWLEEMVSARLLYRSGAGYVFIHGLLQEYLASTVANRREPRVKNPA